MNGARNADQATRKYETFLNSLLKKNARSTDFLSNSRGAQRYVGLFFLIVLFQC